jgi:hypothetical protein
MSPMSCLPEGNADGIDVDQLWQSRDRKFHLLHWGVTQEVRNMFPYNRGLKGKHQIQCQKEHQCQLSALKMGPLKQSCFQKREASQSKSPLEKARSEYNLCRQMEVCEAGCWAP